MKVGYCRVSTTDQDTAVQRAALEAAGCERIYEEQVSGATADREELIKVMGFVREGDVIVVTKLDRLARNTLDMLTIITELGERGVKFTSIAEPWANTDSPASKLMLTMMAGVATFERERIKERQREGIEAAKAKGVYRGRKPTVPRERVIEMLGQKIGPSRIARELEIGESSVFRIKRELETVDGVNV